MRSIRLTPRLEALEARLPLDGSTDDSTLFANDGTLDTEVGAMPIEQPPDYVLYPQVDPTGATGASVRPDAAVSAFN